MRSRGHRTRKDSNSNDRLSVLLTTETACISGVLDSSFTLTQLTSAPWANASAMTGKFCRAAERYSSAPGWRWLRSSSSSSSSLSERFNRCNVMWFFSKAVQALFLVDLCFVEVLSHLCGSLNCSSGQGHWGLTLKREQQSWLLIQLTRPLALSKYAFLFDNRGDSLLYLWPEAEWLCSVWAWAAVSVRSVWPLGFSCRWIASAGGSCQSQAAYG